MTVAREGSQSGLFTVRVGTGPVVFVLHGGPGASHDYLRPQMDGVAEGRELVYYDQRGAGRSRDLPPGGWREHVADLDGLREAITPGRPATLVGYSWGGLLALLYALEHPDRVARLCLVAPAPPVHTYREEMAQAMRARAATPGVRALEERAEALRGEPEAYRRARFAVAVAPYFFDPAQAPALTPFRVQQRAEQAVLGSLGTFDLRPRLPGLAVPLLIVQGVDDVIPIRYARETARLVPGARLVEIAACGHVPYVEQPAALFAATRPFLAG
jgi:proline iminopeptidase